MEILQSKWPRAVSCVAFSSEGRRLFAGGSGGFGCWYPITGHPPWFIEYHATKRFYAFVPDPRERWLYISDPWGGCSLLSITTLRWSRLPGDGDHHVVSLSVSSDGSRVVASRGGSGFNRIECWVTDVGTDITAAWRVLDDKPSTTFDPVYFDRLNGFTNAVAFSPDGRSIATLEKPSQQPDNSGYLLRLRDAHTGELLQQLGEVPGSVGVRLSFVPDGNALLVWEDRWLELWNVKGGSRVTRITPPGRAYFRDAAVHPSGRFFVTVANDGVVRHWDMKACRQTHSLDWKFGRLHAVAFSPDGTRAAVGSDTGKVLVWDVDV